MPSVQLIPKIASNINSSTIRDETYYNMSNGSGEFDNTSEIDIEKERRQLRKKQVKEKYNNFMRST